MIGESFFLTTFGAILAIVVGSAVTGGVAYIIKGQASMVKDAREARISSQEVRDAVAGRVATDLDPTPPPGLINISKGHTQAILDTAEQVKLMAAHQLAQNGKVSDIQKMVKKLSEAGEVRDASMVHSQLEVLSAVAQIEQPAGGGDA